MKKFSRFDILFQLIYAVPLFNMLLLWLPEIKNILVKEHRTVLNSLGLLTFSFGCITVFMMCCIIVFMACVNLYINHNKE